MRDTGQNSLIVTACLCAIMIMVGWLLYIGQLVLVPVVIAVVAVYVIDTAAEALGRVPGLAWIGRGWRRAIVLLGCLAVVLALGGLVAYSVTSITADMPVYIANLDILQWRLVAMLGLDDVPSVADYTETVLDSLDLITLLPSILTTLSGSGSFLLAAGLYAAFILAGMDHMPARIRVALEAYGSADATLEVVRKINLRIGAYLSAKTFINVILGLASWVVMWALGIDHAMFWALLIALLNYIPYFGSAIGVAFPVTMSLVQFAVPLHSVLTLFALAVPQMVVGYYIEPKVLGKSVNLNPLTVLFALSIWGAIWGLIGAVLAVPLTAIMVIVLAEFKSTRFLAVLLSDSGEV